ncbi:MAG TPA: flagellar biosynthetic protein FliO [Terracidiphilus sp.]|jgi:flagellar biogenesis protein FliO|nr:flagellar biosynthetic protein FliO [Terracidiphilus sp.]
MFRIDRGKVGRTLRECGGVVAWLLYRLQTGAKAREERKSQLTLLDRISLAPRQSLALVEAEGRRFLIGTSPDSGPVFYALQPSSATLAQLAKPRALKSLAGFPGSKSTRVSW